MNSYSHDKFYTYISLPEVHLIISIIFEEVGIKSFIENEWTNEWMIEAI